MHFFFAAMSLASPLRRRSLRRSRSCNISPLPASRFPANFTLFISPEFAGSLEKYWCLRVWRRMSFGNTGPSVAEVLWRRFGARILRGMDLVTGPTGYVGGRLMERLLRE